MPDLDQIREQFTRAGQGHVFAAWDSLDQTSRRHLLGQAASVDLEELSHLATSVRAGAASGSPLDLEGIEPAPFITLPEHGGDAAEWRAAAREGEEALRSGRVAAFTVAGGQGTRLGFQGPKGTYPVGPVTGRTLFETFALKIRAASRRHGKPVPWLVMTSASNHAATVAFFENHGHFGLAPEDVLFFSQGEMPAVDFEGRILMESPGSLALAPDGHGGSLRALVRSGQAARLQEQGIDTLSYFQVDNPLVRAVDPAFIGFHLRAGSDMSSKMVPKAYPGEKVGHFCRLRDENRVIEYTDFPAEMMEAQDERGGLRFGAGSVAIHLLSVPFVEKVGSGAEERFRLPFHRAVKKVPVGDGCSPPAAPDRPNGVKFEMFVFDALPLARAPVVVEALRGEEFSPVKNAGGRDSPQTCRDDQLRRWARWLAGAGCAVPTDGSGLPGIVFEVSPGFADDPETFAAEWRALESPPAIVAGAVIRPAWEK